MSGSLVRIVAVDHDAAVDGDARLLGELHVGPDADRHHHQVGWQARAVVELDALDATVADDGLGVGPRQHLDATRLDGALQEMASGGIELALHQRRHQVHDGDVHALRLQAGGGFEAQKAAADDDGAAARLGGEQHGLDVVEIAIGQHARQVVAWHGMMIGLEPVATISLS
jgi:hypothetical protein